MAEQVLTDWIAEALMHNGQQVFQCARCMAWNVLRAGNVRVVTNDGTRYYCNDACAHPADQPLIMPVTGSNELPDDKSP